MFSARAGGRSPPVAEAIFDREAPHPAERVDYQKRNTGYTRASLISQYTSARPFGRATGVMAHYTLARARTYVTDWPQRLISQCTRARPSGRAT